MTRKDYDAIARGLQRVKPASDGFTRAAETAQWERICRSVADVLAEEHPTYGFKTAKFLLACGIIEPQPV